MYSVTAKNLTKTYRTQVKQPGLRAAFRALVRPEYREVQAVRGIDLQVEQGQRLAFIGPNGAGKSTTIKMMTGILSPHLGRAFGAGAFSHGEPAGAFPAHRHGIRPEIPALVPPAGGGQLQAAGGHLRH